MRVRNFFMASLTLLALFAYTNARSEANGSVDSLKNLNYGEKDELARRIDDKIKNLESRLSTIRQAQEADWAAVRNDAIAALGPDAQNGDLSGLSYVDRQKLESRIEENVNALKESRGRLDSAKESDWQSIRDQAIDALNGVQNGVKALEKKGIDIEGRQDRTGSDNRKTGP